MIKQAKYLAFPALLAISCNSPQKTGTVQNTPPPVAAEKQIGENVLQPAAPDIKKERAIQDQYLKRMETPAQHIVTTGKMPSVVKGQQGTIIKVVPNDMVTEEGQPVVDDINIELKELTGAEDFIKNNAPTVCDGRVLESGGSYYVNMTSGGKQLKLKQGKTLQVNFPKKTDKDMALFYGQPDATGKITWKQADQKFVSKKSPAKDTASIQTMAGRMPRSGTMSAAKFRKMVTLTDTMSEEQAKDMDKMDLIASGVYDEVKLQQFGWLNCDRFIEGQTTDFAYQLDPKDSIISATAYLIFRDKNSVVQDYYNCHTRGRFSRLPVNLKATLVVLSVRRGTVFTAKRDVTTGIDNNIMPTLKETSDNEVRNLFRKG